jgi:hypothetical protein
VVEDGRVIALGTHTELLANEPRYIEILAQAETEEEHAFDDAEDAVDTHRLIQHEIDVDVADTRRLDEEVGIESSPNTVGGPNPAGRIV